MIHERLCRRAVDRAVAYSVGAIKAAGLDGNDLESLPQGAPFDAIAGTAFVTAGVANDAAADAFANETPVEEARLDAANCVAWATGRAALAAERTHTAACVAWAAAAAEWAGQGGVEDAAAAEDALCAADVRAAMGPDPIVALAGDQS